MKWIALRTVGPHATFKGEDPCYLFPYQANSGRETTQRGKLPGWQEKGIFFFLIYNTLIVLVTFELAPLLKKKKRKINRDSSVVLQFMQKHSLDKLHRYI